MTTHQVSKARQVNLAGLFRIAQDLSDTDIISWMRLTASLRILFSVVP